MLLVASLLLAAQGCCTYRSADNDPGIPQLLGRRCILMRDASFPVGGSHWLPTIDPPNDLRDPLLALEKGSVLRVSHVEYWSGPIDPSGSIVFADVVEGRSKGRRVKLGEIYYRHENDKPDSPGIPAVLIWNKSGRAIRPFSPEDGMSFYADDVVNGLHGPVLLRPPGTSPPTHTAPVHGHT